MFALSVGRVKGWSKTASRNNTKFLRSVYVPDLSGAAVAFTLTIRDCPPTSDDWKILRETFIKRLRRAGMVRLHWLTEWQKRGVPHLHGIAYFPAAYEAATVSGIGLLLQKSTVQTSVLSMLYLSRICRAGLCTWLNMLAALRLTISVT